MSSARHDVFFLLKIAPLHGRSGPPSTACFPRPTRVHNPNVSRLVQPFLHSSRRVSSGMTFPKIAALLGPPESIHSHSSSAICARLTSECRRACRCPSPSILLIPISAPHLRRGSLGQPDSASETTSHLGSAGTAHGSQSLYFTMGAPFPPKLPLPLG